MSTKPKVTFLYEFSDPKIESYWRDGLWAALNLLESDFDIDRLNIANRTYNPSYEGDDFVLGWGGLTSKVYKHIEYIHIINTKKATGLCLGGYAPPSLGRRIDLDILFYENEWALKNFVTPIVQVNPKLKYKHAFGVNTDIYKPNACLIGHKMFDYLSVGAFAIWKRHERLMGKTGVRMAVGELQKGNIDESYGIAFDLISKDITVSNMVPPESLANLYNLSRTVYIPANLMGGGERAVLEARACGCKVEIEDDNEKLKELLASPIWNHHYYAKQLKEGIWSVL